MKCEACSHEFHLDRHIGYPGHVDPPGTYIIYIVISALLLVPVLIATCFCLNWIACAWELFLAGQFMLTCYRKARESVGLCVRTGGHICPQCRHEQSLGVVSM